MKINKFILLNKIKYKMKMKNKKEPIALYF